MGGRACEEVEVMKEVEDAGAVVWIVLVSESCLVAVGVEKLDVGKTAEDSSACLFRVSARERN